MKQHAVPDDAAIAAELSEIFRAELAPHYAVPSADQLAELVLEISTQRRAANLPEAFRQACDRTEQLLTAWRKIRAGAVEARSGIRGLRRMPDLNWNLLASENPGLEELRHALELLGPQLDSPPPTGKHRPGPDKMILENKFARYIADLIAHAMRRAGNTRRISRTSSNGPVARIGAALYARLLNEHLGAAAFAERVKKALQ